MRDISVAEVTSALRRVLEGWATQPSAVGVNAESNTHP
jgi:hypothetical protein